MKWVRRVIGLVLCLGFSYLVVIELGMFVTHSRGVRAPDLVLFAAMLYLESGLIYLGYRLIRS